MVDPVDHTVYQCPFFFFFFKSNHKSWNAIPIHHDTYRTQVLPCSRCMCTKFEVVIFRLINSRNLIGIPAMWYLYYIITTRVSTSNRMTVERTALYHENDEPSDLRVDERGIKPWGHKSFRNNSGCDILIYNERHRHVYKTTWQLIAGHIWRTFTSGGLPGRGKKVCCWRDFSR